MTSICDKELQMVNGLHIVKTWETDLHGKEIKNTTIYMVNDDEENNLDCFKTLKEARDYARNYY